jgi:hypothetical protein
MNGSRMDDGHQAVNHPSAASPLNGGTSPPTHPPPHMDVKSETESMEEELLLKWDDHHKSFFELAEDLCHQEQFIDVTLSCGEHNFPAHKLILSVCSPYFRQLFLRNPCKHPIVVLKDVHFKYMKLLLMYMYRGEVSCPQEDLHGLLKTARSLQIRGLVELERKREAEGLLTNSLTGSPIKHRINSPTTDMHMHDGASVASGGQGDRDSLNAGETGFSLDDVRSRLHGQLEIQPVSQQPTSSLPPHWFEHQRSAGGGGGGGGRDPPPPMPIISKATSSSNEVGTDGTGTGSEEDERALPPHQRLLNEHKRKWSGNNGGTNSHDLSLNRRSPAAGGSGLGVGGGGGVQHHQPPPPQRSRSRPSSSTATSAAAAANNAALMAAAQAAGMPASALDPSDPMSSMNALLAAAQVGSISIVPTFKSNFVLYILFMLCQSLEPRKQNVAFIAYCMTKLFFISHFAPLKFMASKFSVYNFYVPWVLI